MDKVLFFTAVTTVLVVGFTTFSNALRRKQQAQMHNRLLDKFATAEDLGNFLQSPSGREYVSNLTDNVGNPAPAIIASVRTGIILCVVGIAFFVPSAHELDVEIPSAAIGTLVLALGIGFLVSAEASLLLARKLQLMAKRDDSKL